MHEIDYTPESTIIFGGVLASDELTHRIKHKPIFYIVNTDPSNMPGQPWIVIYIRENVDYFDPLGRAPNRINEHHVSSISPHGYLRMISPVQSQTSRKCGQFCLYYSYYRARNFSMSCIVNSLTLDFSINDYIVQQFVDNYMKYIGMLELDSYVVYGFINLEYSMNNNNYISKQAVE